MMLCFNLTDTMLFIQSVLSNLIEGPRLSAFHNNAVIHFIRISAFYDSSMLGRPGNC